MHVLYNEWSKKYSVNSQDQEMSSNVSGNGSDNLIIGGDLIPMTLQGNGDLRQSQAMSQHFSRFDSIPLETPQYGGSLTRSKGMLAFEAVS